MLQSNGLYEKNNFDDLHQSQGFFEAIEFHHCTFNRCSFKETHILNCKFLDCRFQNCDLSLTQIPECSFSGNTFHDSKLLGIDWTLAQWEGMLLKKPPLFDDCQLNHSTFIGLDLKGVRFKDCLCRNVDFREANLEWANFDGSDLTESLFSKTNLSNADLSQARNYTINPHENIIKEAHFSLPEAMSLLFNMEINLNTES